MLPVMIDSSYPALVNSRNQFPFYFLGGSFFFQTVNRKKILKRRNLKTKQNDKKKNEILVHEIKIFFL